MITSPGFKQRIASWRVRRSESLSGRCSKKLLVKTTSSDASASPKCREELGDGFGSSELLFARSSFHVRENSRAHAGRANKKTPVGAGRPQPRASCPCLSERGQPQYAKSESN